MNKLVALIVFVVVSAGMYVVCANSHIDIFPCERAERPLGAPGDLRGPLPLETSEGMCSLLAHDRGTGPDGEYDRLTSVGWAALAGFCAGIGAVAGVIAGMLTRKRRA